MAAGFTGLKVGAERVIVLYRRDRLSFLFVVLILAIGIFFRVYQYGAEGGVVSDTPGAIAGALKYYYPHEYYPGLLHQYPPFGSLAMGAGCMLSGADFSPIVQQPPNFWPSIPYLIGEPFAQAEKYCLIPSYFASVILLLGIVVLSFSLLDKYSAIYSTSFFALFGVFIQWGRIIFYDVILWVLVVYGLLFLWLAYKAEPGSKNERNYFIVSAMLFGLAVATKYTAGTFLLLQIFLIFEKYSFSIIKNITSIQHLNLKTLLHAEKGRQDYAFFASLKHSLMSSLAFLVAMLLPYGFSIKNFIDVKTAYLSIYPNDGKPVFNPMVFPQFFRDFLFNATIIDTVLAIFSIFILIKIFEKTILSRNASRNERFILYSVILLVVSLTVSSALNTGLTTGLGRRVILFIFGFIFLLSLAFSNSEYSIFRIMKIETAGKKRVFFFIFLFIYIIYSSSVLFLAAPYYAQPTIKNPICVFYPENCAGTPWTAFKLIADTVGTMLKENETVDAVSDELPIYMYLRQKDYYALWQTKQAFLQKYGRNPTVSEMASIFSFEGRRIRYLLITNPSASNETKEIFEKYAAHRAISLNGIYVGNIYDLDNMTLKEN